MTAHAPTTQGDLMTWSSWHLHLATTARSAHDRVLTDVIGPTIGELAPGTPWFFIRYWQAGPHLRLRMRDVDPDAYDRVEVHNIGLLRKFAHLRTMGASCKGARPADRITIGWSSLCTRSYLVHIAHAHSGRVSNGKQVHALTWRECVQCAPARPRSQTTGRVRGLANCAYACHARATF